MRLFQLLLSITIVSLIISVPSQAQPFSSGSTGADGALSVTSGTATVALPPSGVFNYTTVNVASGATLQFSNNLANTPVLMLAQGNVNIAGTINISATGSTPGPGGFHGGDGGSPGVAGWGPGGGQGGPGVDQPGQSGQWVGPLTLFPNIGGSGGGGESVDFYNCPSSVPGGAGGGAITIASSTSITIPSGGIINANGSQGFSTGPCGYAGTFGASGAVRLVANSINVAGSVSASVFRMEAPTGSDSFAGSGTPPVIATINSQIVPANVPSLQITSIGGYAVPANSGSSFSTVDLLLPSQLTDPLAVVVQATNVPPGSPVTINFSNSPSATFPAASLTGSIASSTATLNVSGLNRSGVVYLFVSTTFSASLVSKNLKPLDPAAVSRIELASGIGWVTRYRFLRRDGTEVCPSALPTDLKSQFGL